MEDGRNHFCGHDELSLLVRKTKRLGEQNEISAASSIRVVVTRIDADNKTAGGIIIPDTAKEKPTEGEVIAVGPGGRDEGGELIPIDLKKGDRVLFGKWSGTEVKIEGVEYLIMKRERHHGRDRTDRRRQEGRLRAVASNIRDTKNGC